MYANYFISIDIPKGCKSTQTLKSQTRTRYLLALQQYNNFQIEL